MGKIVERVLGSKNQRDLKVLMPLVGRINELEAGMIALQEADFPAATERFRKRLADGEALDDLAPEAFALVRQADVLIAALGQPLFVKAEWLKPGVAIIDVGTNRIEDPSSERGWRWAGDVDFERARQVAGAISRVPGGVGPMTITMLLRHTLLAAQRSLGPRV